MHINKMEGTGRSRVHTTKIEEVMCNKLMLQAHNYNGVICI